MSFFTRDLDPVPALKQQLAAVLVQQLDGFTTEIAGTRVGLTRERMGDLRNGKLDDFSLQRLVRCVHRFGGAVELAVVSSREVSNREYQERAEAARALVRADRERRERLAEKRRAARLRSRARRDARVRRSG